METWLKRMERMPELLQSVHATGKDSLGVNDRGILALVSEQRLRRILTRMLDENEFLSPTAGPCRRGITSIIPTSFM